MELLFYLIGYTWFYQTNGVLAAPPTATATTVPTCVTPASYCDLAAQSYAPYPVCFNHGICIDASNTWMCVCPTGYVGRRCQSTLDQCMIYRNPCQNGATCTSKITRFECLCPAGFAGILCEVMIDYCQSNPCLHGATCRPIPTGFTCTCQQGWTGLTCSADINECISAPCLNGGICNNTPGSYSCMCQSGYFGPDCTQSTSTESAPSCAPAHSFCSDAASAFAPDPVCMNHGTCVDRPSTWACVCPGGYQGRRCEQAIDQCALYSEPCLNSGTCISSGIRFHCQCPAGYVGTYCQVMINYCQSSPCANGGTCTAVVNSFVCQCSMGWSGTMCNTDVDECLGDICQNGGTCLNTLGSYTCQCPTDIFGQNCEYVLSDGQSCTMLSDMQPCPEVNASDRLCNANGVCMRSRLDENNWCCLCSSSFCGQRCEQSCALHQIETNP